MSSRCFKKPLRFEMKRNEECYKFVNIRAPVELSTRLVLEILHKQKSGQQISQKDFEKSLL